LRHDCLLHFHGQFCVGLHPEFTSFIIFNNPGLVIRPKSIPGAPSDGEKNFPAGILPFGTNDFCVPNMKGELTANVGNAPK
jgi:hypothetical protein